jgi:chromosome partitioning protein
MAAKQKLAPIIAVCNQKGGCGKTTSVINIAAGLAQKNLRVLVIDLDSQGNATTGLGIDTAGLESTIFDLLLTPTAACAEEVILETEFKNLHIAPASIELAEYEARVASEIGRENKLKKALSHVQGLYDVILIDTPPSLGLLSVNALNASQEVFITMQAHPFAFDGLHLLLNTIQLIQEELNPSLKVGGVIVTMFDSRTKISKEIYEKLKLILSLKNKVFKTVIRQNIKITESSKARQPIFKFDASCTGSADYENLCKEIAAMLLPKAKKQESKLVSTEASI